MPDPKMTFYEFFAGGGMARAGLGPNWECLFANDFDCKKSKTYKMNWRDDVLKVCDVGHICPTDLPGRADLIWASFPCQDLSLAGNGAGLKGERSGTFWPFWELVKSLRATKREPRVVVLENVCGTLTSHGGSDFQAIATALVSEGYRFGSVVIDAVHFVPQSRPRLFFVAVARSEMLPRSLESELPSDLWHPTTLRSAYELLPSSTKSNWIWWRINTPPPRNIALADLIEEHPKSVEWHEAEETARIVRMMSDRNRRKLEEAASKRCRMVGTVYKRTRRDEDGKKVQRAEVRFDDIAGCLRTPAGGSSRQLILVVDGDTLRSRLISSRETARLMGLDDEYRLPENYNEAYHLTGDGVVVPVVRHLAQNVIEPIVTAEPFQIESAA